MTYQEIERYISEIPKFTKKHSLSHTKRFLEILQIPQGKMKILHVAGTNGKGSVCAYLDAMLRSEGKRTGLFISPHLVKMNERIMIDGVPVSDEVFSEVFTQTLGAVKQMEAEGLEHPTFFEFLFGMGMLAFSQAEAEYVILETGLGGRLDATTAVENPAACVITSISLDHMQYLGNTVSEIAGEKAGIMVPGVPVIYDGNDPDAARVMREHAETLGCPYYELKREDTRIHEITKDGIKFSLKDEAYGDTVFDIPFIARYQVMNAALAVKTIQVLEDQIPVSLEALKAGMAKTRWQGRMETVLPGVIVDGAHNEDGVEKFVETAAHFQKQYPQTKLVRVIKGSVFDVAVDLRSGSETYGKWYGIELTEENKKQFLIPRGFAHGFLVLSDTAEFCYKCDDFYHPNDEGGMAWNDPEIGIEWPKVKGEYRGNADAEGYTLEDGTALNLSDKDQKWLGLKDTFKF